MLKLANRLLPRLWAAGALPWPDFQAATLVAMARRQTGLEDFGDSGFRPALDAYLAALATEAQPNPFGRVIAQGSALEVLKGRLRAAELFRRHPEILARRIVAPIVIAGPMRSGTTRLHRLLAQDPAFAHLRLFEAMRPVPPPPGRADRRAALVRAALGFLEWVNPAIAAIHPTGPNDPDEELGLLEASFWGAQLEAQRPIPSYARWCETAGAGPAYDHMARLLKLIGWARGEDDSKPWLLKTPQHMANLPALIAAFPDARIIHTHRDPVRVVGSAASLAWNQMVVQTDALDPAWVGAEWLRKTAHRVEATRAARATIAAGGLDIAYAAMDADAMGEVARVYRWLGRDLTAPVRARMDAYLARERRRPRHAAHRYELADFGLTAEAIEARLGDYRQAYAIARERLPGSAHHGVSG